MNIFDIFNLRKRCDGLESRIKQLEFYDEQERETHRNALVILTDERLPLADRHSRVLELLTVPDGTMRALEIVHEYFAWANPHHPYHWRGKP